MKPNKRASTGNAVVGTLSHLNMTDCAITEAPVDQFAARVKSGVFRWLDRRDELFGTVILRWLGLGSLVHPQVPGLYYAQQIPGHVWGADMSQDTVTSILLPAKASKTRHPGDVLPQGLVGRVSQPNLGHLERIGQSVQQRRVALHRGGWVVDAVVVEKTVCEGPGEAHAARIEAHDVAV
ncbi:hypothetical protein PpBr36_01590 [Pyricularia pennisetigena]|uniref:hypothetical protein n=1 Tax=Pyricularia pennisetigena TaxID=1578925 RepID=UPI00114FA28E|nr:hypothetical protein PpBr36_01590 [Pyricularia pennisetigena]TLS27889.1 hypothetical protein PpBr36_01590 [Pyricularia pennisetigena]